MNLHPIKAIKIAKRKQTIDKFLKTQKLSVTVFEKITNGSWFIGGKITSTIIADRIFEVYEGVITDYPNKLQQHQKIIKTWHN